MEIKKLIRNTLIYTCCFAAMYVLFLFLLYKIRVSSVPLVYRTSDVICWKGGNTFMKFNDFDKSKSYDVIVIGSSHAYRGYDPRIFKKAGIEMFNLGTSGQSIMNSYYISKNYIHAKNCKLVILDIYDGALASDGMESTADLIQNISSGSTALEMGIALKDPRVFNMLSVRWFAQKAPAMYVDSSYVGAGYSEKSDTVKRIEPGAYRSDLQINEQQEYYLKELLQYFNSNNIKVVAITHPVPKETSKSSHVKFRKLVDELVAEQHISYFDYSESIQLNTRTDFYDHHHLNQSGVEKFDSVLIRDLNEKGYFNWK